MALDRGEGGAGSLDWLRNKRVLLAEDNITNQMVATQMLDALGARVDVANDGAEALEMIEAQPYDLYLIDIEMPRVSGLDVIRAIRAAEPPLCNATVIAVTAYALREHREKISEAGASGLIPKPLVGIEQFGRDIVRIADTSQAPVAAEAAPQSAGTTGEAVPRGPVSLEVFNALAEAIGPEAMQDLLGKIDGDLARVESELKTGLQSKEASAITGATHVLISVSGAIGAQTIQTLAQRLSAAASGRNGEDPAAVGAETLMQITVLRAFVKGKMTTARG